MRLFLFSMKPLCYLLFFLCACSLVKGQQTYDLSNLNLQLMTSGYGQARADVASSGGPLTLEGKTYRGSVHMLKAGYGCNSMDRENGSKPLSEWTMLPEAKALLFSE